MFVKLEKVRVSVKRLSNDPAQIVTVNLQVHSTLFFLVGVTYNVSLLRDVLNHPKFRLGDITTKFLPQEYPSGFKGKESTAQ